MKISILIPVYNVEHYISRCLDSIYSQEFDADRFEVICVNDGSTDSSGATISNYLDKHNNLKLVNKENSGVSAARNVALSQANGDYVCFLDADDYLISDSLKKMYDYIQTVKASDLVIFRAFDHDSKMEKYAWKSLFQVDEVYNGQGLVRKGYLRGSVWGVAYNKQFLSNNQIKFIEGVRNGEDTIFFATCMAKANQIRFADIPLYGVCNRPGSATSVNDKVVKGMSQTLKRAGALREDERFKDSINIVELLLYILISNTVDYGIRAHWSCEKLNNEVKISSYLPIKMKGLYSFRYSIVILNFSLILFYCLFKLRYSLNK